LLLGLLALAPLPYPMTIVQEWAVFEKVETRFCECCAGEAFTAAPAPYVPPSMLLIFLTFFWF
jgi:hypothetical protein